MPNNSQMLMGQQVVLSVIGTPKLALHDPKVLRGQGPLTEKAILAPPMNDPNLRSVRSFLLIENGFRAAIRRPLNGELAQQIVEVQYSLVSHQPDDRVLLAFGEIGGLPLRFSIQSGESLHIVHSDRILPLNGQTITRAHKGVLFSGFGFPFIVGEVKGLKEKMETSFRNSEVSHGDYADLIADTIVQHIAQFLESLPPEISARARHALEQIYEKTRQTEKA